MFPEVEKLLKVQGIDGRLEILRKEIEKRPEAMAAQGDEIAEKEQRRQELNELRTSKQVALDRLDLEIKSFDEKIADSTKKLGTLSDGSQYSAMQKQIQRFEGEKSGYEEQVVAAMEEMDRIRKAEREVLDSLGVAEEERTEDEDEFEKEFEEIRKEGMELLQKREGAVVGIDEEALEHYERLFTRYRERSVVTANGGVCDGCHMAVSPQTINLLRQERTIVHCNHCSRILFL